MSTREVIRRGGESGGVPFHEHDASEISGKFDFLRALKAIIDGTVEIGGTVTVSADQLFIDNVLQHINLRETDDGDYPNKVFIVDVNGGLGRMFWLDQTGAPTFTNVMTFAQDGSINVSTGPFSPTDGTAAAPAIVRDATADGIFFASGVVGLAIGGSEVARTDAGGLVFTVDGSAANPAIARSATEDGIFFASGAVGVAIGGSEVARFGTGFIGPWTTWTPSYSNITVGTGGGAGTVVARYCKIGSTVHGYFKFTLGSGSAIGGAVSISTPVTASSNYGTAAGSPIIGSVFFNDTTDSTNNAVGIARLYPDGDTMLIQVLNTSGTYSNEDNIGSTIPFTWANADWLGFSFTYEAA